jgi:3-oxoacyl-[acyl-carrier protein] reductase
MTLANELARYRITSNVVEPGVTNSATFAKNFGPNEIKAAEATIPLGRISQPHDIGHACLFFCLPETSIITGQVLAVDGGLSTGGAQAPPEDAAATGRPDA